MSIWVPETLYEEAPASPAPARRRPRASGDHQPCAEVKAYDGARVMQAAGLGRAWETTLGSLCPLGLGPVTARWPLWVCC